MNVYSALQQLTHLVSLSDWSLGVWFMPALASNLVILAHER